MKNQKKDKKSAPLFATPAKNKPLAVKSNVKAGEVRMKDPGP